MLKQYSDYFWKNGLPVGKAPLEADNCVGTSYKIVMDPYRKRVSIERYQNREQLEGIIYDSALINFRKLSPESQTRWQRVIEKETETTLQSLIRDEDDRVIFREHATFLQNRCRECRIESPHGLFLAYQKILYTHLGDAFNGVVLYDVLDKPVMCKRYAYDEENQDFGELIHEEWEIDSTLLEI